MKKAISKVRQTCHTAIIFFGLGALSTVIGSWLWSGIGNNAPKVYEGNSPNNVSLYEIIRSNGFKNIQPVVALELNKESKSLQPLKASLETMIDSLKKAGIVKDVSVYLKNFNDGEQISISGDLTFHPASLMKVPLMLLVLKRLEATPGLLEQTFVYEKEPDMGNFQQHFQGPTITEGKSYRVHDLLFHSAANSDNTATNVLETNIDLSHAMQLFERLGIPSENLQDKDYSISAKEYSKFMSAIFNAAFVRPEYSEYAAALLAQSSFKEGFVKGLPKDIQIWHKFGEWRRMDGLPELHESGTIFFDGKPYLLTVMTRGKSLDNLATVLQQMAATVAKHTMKHGYGIARNQSQNFSGC